MLILTRKVNEALMIGNQITLKILSIRGNQVRLGIAAPSDVRVYREEILPETPEGESKEETVA